MKIRRKAFIAKSDAGDVVTDIFCKVCGKPIATEQMVQRPDGKTGLRFSRLPNYTELKMQFDNGSYHVTNGCNQCLHNGLKPGDLQQLYKTDVAEDPDSYSAKDKKRKAVRVIALGVGLP